MNCDDCPLLVVIEQLTNTIIVGRRGRRINVFKKQRRKDLTEIIKLLLNHPDININIQGKDGITPLFMASKSNDVEAVKLLLEYGKDTIDFQLKVTRNNSSNELQQPRRTTRSTIQTARDVTTNKQIKSLIDECIAYQKKEDKGKIKAQQKMRI